MRTTLRIRRCLEAELPSEGGYMGEICYCDDTDKLVIGEGIGKPWTVFTSGLVKALLKTGGIMTGDIILADGTAIVPATAEGATLGTAEKPFKDIFVGANSIYVDGNKVIDSNNTTINITTTPDQHLAIHTTGLGTTRLASGKEIMLYSGGDINHQALGDFEVLSKGRVATITDVDGQDIVFETQGVLSNINFKSKHQINLDAPSINLTSTPMVNGVPLGSGGSSYTHPATHPATMITEDDTHLFVTIDDKANWNDKYTQSETDARIQDIVGTAPAALDTLNELAAALNNDANFAASVTTNLSQKESISNKGIANGYASLGTDGKVPAAQLPASASGVTSVNGKTGSNITLTASDISDDADHRFVTDAEKALWNSGTGGSGDGSGSGGANQVVSVSGVNGASDGTPYSVDVTLANANPSLKYVATSILKLSSVATPNQNTMISDFNPEDKITFNNTDDEVIFDGKLKLKTKYEYPLQPKTPGDYAQYSNTVIDFEQYNVDQVEVFTI